MQRNRFTKKVLAFSVALGFTAASLAGCSGGETKDTKDEGGSGEAVTRENMAGEWTMENGKGPDGEFEALEDAPVVLDIQEDGAFSGTSGCNTIFGSMTIEDGKIDMGAVGQTMMACPEEMMTLENKYTSAIDLVDAGTISDDTLTLTGPETEIHYKRS